MRKKERKKPTLGTRLASSRATGWIERERDRDRDRERAKRVVEFGGG